jgi:hypothetical protein
VGTKYLFSTGRSRAAKAMMLRFARAVGRTSKSAQLRAAAQERAAQNGRPDPKLRLEPTQAADFRSRPWAVAIGTACLLAAMAPVMAF